MPEPATTFEQMEDIASFKPGYWKGRWYDEKWVKAMHDNFQRFSLGANPYYVPFLNINHNDELRHGAIFKTRMDGDTLILSAKNIPSDIAALIKSGQLGERSIEFYEPKQIDGKWDGFFDENGKLVNGPVIRCLSWLGNEAPAVKGLGPLPKPTPQRFHDRKVCRRNERCVSKFSSAQGTTMNPDLIEKLKALGFDVSLIPADATDDLLNAIIGVMQAANGNPAPESPVPETMSAPVLPAPVAPAPTPTPSPVVPAVNGQPSQITMKFMEDYTRATVAAALAPTNAAINRLRAENLVLRNANADGERKRKEAIVDTFLDSVKRQVIPAMRASVKSHLMKCDSGKVRTFSDGKTTGTELEEEMKTIRESYPVHKLAPGDNPTPKIPQGPVNQDAADTIDQNRVNRVLQATPEGRAALKRQQAAATGNRN